MKEHAMNAKISVFRLHSLNCLCFLNTYLILPNYGKESLLTKVLTKFPNTIFKNRKDIFFFGVATGTEELMTDSQFAVYQSMVAK
jgi:hypothetical protein